MRASTRCGLRIGRWAVCGALLAAIWLASGWSLPPAAAADRHAKKFQADRFRRVFHSNREDARFKLLGEIPQFYADDPAVPDALWQAIQHDLDVHRSSPSLLQAVQMHGSYGDESAIAQQETLLSVRNRDVAMIAALGLADRQTISALPKLIKLADSPEYRASYPFRHVVVSSVGSFPDPTSVDFLVSAVEKNPGQLRYVAARQLSQLTGQNHGGVAEDWKQWWGENREGFQFARVSRESEFSSVALPDVARKNGPEVAKRPGNPVPEIAKKNEMPWPEEVPRFFGDPLYARRFVFVIDRSRSMESSVDGVTRLEECQKELESAIKKLPSDAWFSVIAYESNILLWQPRLVPATPENKIDAIRFSRRLFPINKTACYDALVQALGIDPDLEMIVFLSDGEPTAGKIVDPPAILADIVQCNRLRRVAIDVIGIDAQASTAQFLKDLAQQNFGTYRPVR